LVLVVLAAASPLVWWRVSVDQYRLTEGIVTSPGPLAAQNSAGEVEEFCYAFVPGRTIRFGFSVLNSGGHDVTLRSVGQMFAGVTQSVTVDTNTDGGADGPETATRLPVVIRPGDNRLIYVDLTPKAGITMQAGQSTTGNAVDLRFTVLDVSHLQRFAINDGDTYITFEGVDPKKNSCDHFQPAPDNA
jgi:hypothetical protein